EAGYFEASWGLSAQYLRTGEQEECQHRAGPWHATAPVEFSREYMAMPGEHRTAGGNDLLDQRRGALLLVGDVGLEGMVLVGRQPNQVADHGPGARDQELVVLQQIEVVWRALGHRT